MITRRRTIARRRVILRRRRQSTATAKNEKRNDRENEKKSDREKKSDQEKDREKRDKYEEKKHDLKKKRDRSVSDRGHEKDQEKAREEKDKDKRRRDHEKTCGRSDNRLHKRGRTVVTVQVDDNPPRRSCSQGSETSVEKANFTTQSIEMGDIEGHVLVKVPLVSNRSVTPPWQIMAQDRVAVISTGEQEMSWSHGALVATLGKGKHNSHPNTEQINKESEILFYPPLPDHTRKDLYKDTVTTLGDLVCQRKETTTEVNVNCHKTTPQVAAASCVSSQQGVKEEQEQAALDASQASAAALLQTSKWQTDTTGIMWHVTWGLMPVMAQVVCKGDGALGPGQAMMICDPA